MPLKITKEMSSHLIKYVRTVNFSFNGEFRLNIPYFECVSAGCTSATIPISDPDRSITTRLTHGHPRQTAFDSRTRSAREVMRQFESDRFTRANPKLRVKADVHSRPTAPEVKVAFVDGTEVAFDSQEYIAADMIMDIWRSAMKLDDEFEMEGKNVDDVA